MTRGERGAVGNREGTLQAQRRLPAIVNLSQERRDTERVLLRTSRKAVKALKFDNLSHVVVTFSETKQISHLGLACKARWLSLSFFAS